MPQKMLMPWCCPTVLWINSVISTVLPTPAPPNRPALAAPFQGGQHVDGLDTGFKDFGDDGALGQRYGRLVDGAPFAPQYCFLLIDHRTEDVEHPAQEPFPHRHFQVVAQVQHRRAPGQPVSGRQGDAPHDLGAQVGHHFDDDASLRTGAELVVNGEEAVGENAHPPRCRESIPPCLHQSCSGRGVHSWNHSWLKQFFAFSPRSSTSTQ